MEICKIALGSRVEYIYDAEVLKNIEPKGVVLYWDEKNRMVFEKNEGGEHSLMKTAAQTAVLMMVVTFASKCFGFIREMVIAYYFGASYVTDAFVMAIAIPGIIFGGIIGAVSISYMPTFSKIIELEGEDKANEFTSGVIYILCVIAVTASLIGVLFSDEIVGLLASGFDARTAGLTSFFLRITITFLIFTAVADVLEAFLRYKGVFLPQVAFGLIQKRNRDIGYCYKRFYELLLSSDWVYSCVFH